MFIIKIDNLILTSSKLNQYAYINCFNLLKLLCWNIHIGMFNKTRLWLSKISKKSENPMGYLRFFKFDCSARSSQFLNLIFIPQRDYSDSIKCFPKRSRHLEVFVWHVPMFTFYSSTSDDVRPIYVNFN